MNCFIILLLLFSCTGSNRSNCGCGCNNCGRNNRSDRNSEYGHNSNRSDSCYNDDCGCGCANTAVFSNYNGNASCDCDRN